MRRRIVTEKPVETVTRLAPVDANGQRGMPWHNADRPQNWRTPPALFRELERRFGRGGFDLDAAADDENHLCARYYTEETDALAPDHPWRSRVFANPPYDVIGPWVRKAYAEVDRGHAEVVVLLIPGRTGTAWWAFAEHFGRIEKIRGRVAFLPPPGVEAGSAFEPSVVVIFERQIDAADFRGGEQVPAPLFDGGGA